MRRLVKLSQASLVLLLAVPALLSAQTSSIDVPNSPVNASCPAAAWNVPNPTSGNPKMSVFIKTNFGNLALPTVKVNNPAVSVTTCDTGTTVANKTLDKILVAATNDYTCSAVLGTSPPTCGGAEAGGAIAQLWNFTAKGQPCGFQVFKAGGAGTTSITVSGTTPACVPVGSAIQTNAGNNNTTDLLPQFLVQVNPDGHDGVVTFSVEHSQGGVNPRVFTVNTATTGTNMVALHDAIAAGFNGLGLTGLTAARHLQPGASQFPECFSIPFTSGGVFGTVPLVRVVHPPSVIKYSVKGVPDQLITTETSVTPTGAPIPAVSTGGMALLAVLLLLTGFWMMRRRSRSVAAPQI